MLPQIFQLWPSVLFDKPLSFFEYFWNLKLFLAHFEFFLLYIWSSRHINREPWLLWMVIGTKIWGLGVFVAAGLLLLPSQQIELGNTCVHTNYPPYPTSPTSVCDYPSIYIKTYVFILILLIPVPQGSLQPPLFICNFSLYSEIKGFHFLWYIICSGLLHTYDSFLIADSFHCEKQIYWVHYNIFFFFCLQPYSIYPFRVVPRVT